MTHYTDCFFLHVIDRYDITLLMIVYNITMTYRVTPVTAFNVVIDDVTVLY